MLGALANLSFLSEDGCIGGISATGSAAETDIASAASPLSATPVAAKRTSKPLLLGSDVAFVLGLDAADLLLLFVLLPFFSSFMF